ncbi:MAG: hypothetical protein MJY85_10830 [Fibrobacter sp.]|nr:hypothetical protein [Fibrobacter sp.]
MRGGQFVALSFVVAALLGCSGEVSVDQNYVDAFVELRVIDITFGAQSPASRIARQEVLKKHGYTLESFLAKTDKVLEDENMWVPFQKAVTVRIDEKIAELSNTPKVEEPVESPGHPKAVPSTGRKRGKD